MIFHLVIAIAMAACTWVAGWWGVAIVALIAGFIYRERRGRAWLVALGATEGWILLLIVDAAFGPLRMLGDTLGGAMSLPPATLYLLTLLFPALLAWSGAMFAASIGQLPLKSSPALNRG
ncbi:MAG: hypothetical protein V4550_20980 [Gemmatimonadota bacterium]